MEFILEVLLEGVFAVTVENPKVKTWIKTTVFLVTAQILTVLLIWITADAWQSNNDGWIVGGIVTAGCEIGVIIGAIFGHRRNWISC